MSVNSKPVVFAIFAGIISGSSFAAFWYIYERINRATRLDNLRETNYNIEQLNTAIDTLRKEIEELKAVKSSNKADLQNIIIDEDTKSKKSIKMVRFKNTLSYLSSASDTDYQSAWSDNEASSEEFFDFPENELTGEHINSKYAS